MSALPRNVLVLGAGPLRIAQAGEFDYACTQALKALRQAGVRSVVVNPNAASVQSLAGQADRFYCLPLTREALLRVLAREPIDAILIGFGGQSALNLGLELAETGVLAAYGIRLLGAPLASIRICEDRLRFARFCRARGIPVAAAEVFASAQAALAQAETIAYPVFCRRPYALGGLQAGLIEGPAALRALLAQGWDGPLLLEQSLSGWIEVEFEVLRDQSGQMLAVCALENLDPIGIHTGDSYVVTPTQTLSAREYYGLRELAFRLLAELALVGECNVQFALEPGSRQVKVIEINPRLSRSSALASKATLYPIAWVAAWLLLGKPLAELEHPQIPGLSCAFEPVLDYVVVKAPVWDFERFPGLEPRLGAGMRSIGEVMGVGRSFAEALGKAWRQSAGPATASGCSDQALAAAVATASPQRLEALLEAFARGWKLERVQALSSISAWFLAQIEQLARLLAEIRCQGLEPERLRQAKAAGLSDAQLAACLGLAEAAIAAQRRAWGILPVARRMEPFAGTYPSRLQVWYLSYGGREHEAGWAPPPPYLLLGSGGFRIGASLEFDWSCVSAARRLRAAGQAVAVLNCNPETVSTDPEECDQLWLEELSAERLADLLELLRPAGVLAGYGGQLPHSLLAQLPQLPLTGTPAASILTAENRQHFCSLLDRLGIPQPAWQACGSRRQASAFAASAGFPLLLRPGFVLGGSRMQLIHSPEQLEALPAATAASDVLNAFLEQAREFELDGVAQAGRIGLYAFSENLEPAGLHSGDSCQLYPVRSLPSAVLALALERARRLAAELRISGPFNLQFLWHRQQLLVLECNLRASRSLPFLARVSGVNLAAAAVDAQLGLGWPGAPQPLPAPCQGVRLPVYSFQRLPGARIRPGLRMQSTGEATGLGAGFAEALSAALQAAGYPLPPAWILLQGEAGPTGLPLPVYRWQQAGGPDRPEALLALPDYRRGLVVSLIRPGQADPAAGDELRSFATRAGIPLLTSPALWRELSQLLAQAGPGGQAPIQGQAGADAASAAHQPRGDGLHLARPQP